MSTIDIKVRSDFEIKKHENADRLEVLEIGGEGGFTSVVAKGQFKPGDKIIYIPPDSVLPNNILEKLRQTSKIDLKDSRIRAIRIRQQLSYGLCLKPEEWLPENLIKEGKDVAEYLGITKYEPPPPKMQGDSNSGFNIKYINENFSQYTNLEHFRKYPKALQDGEDVVITIKYHGCNWRAGIVKRPKYKLSLLEKVKIFIKGLFFKHNTTHEYLVGTHRTILKQVNIKRKDQNKYWYISDKYKIEKELQNEMRHNPNIYSIILYGELIGPGIQKYYTYGIDNGDNELRIFDIKINGKYIDWDDVVNFCAIHGLPPVHVEYKGPWNKNLLKIAEAHDKYDDVTHVREGIVIKTSKERRDFSLGRVIVKHLNPEYELNKKNSEGH